jgi:hypothetical protein
VSIGTDGKRPTDDPLWQRVPTPLHFDGAALGLGIHIDTNSPAIIALAKDAFGRFERPEGGRVDLHMEVVAASGLDAVDEVAATDAAGAEVAGDAEDVEDVEIVDDGSAVGENPPPSTASPSPSLFHRERGSLYTAGDDRGSVVVADLAGGRAAAFVTPATPPEIVRTVLLESPVWRFAAWRGLVALHAAAIVVDGVTLVLRGLGGSGKSTLAYAAARAGHRLLAEEVTWFDPTIGPAPLLRGAPWTVHLEPDALALFPEIAGQPLVRQASGKRKLAADVAGATGNCCVERAPLGPIVFLDRSAGETGWARIEDADARRRFDAGLLAAERTQRPAGLEAARDALIGRGAFVLRFDGPAGALAGLEAIRQFYTSSEHVTLFALLL